MTTVINQRLWNSALGVYSIGPDDPGNYSVNGIAFAITSGIANTSQATSSIAKLSSLRLGPGFKDSSLVNSSDPTVNLSPNTNGFLLDALMQSNATTESRFLLDHLWTAMISSDATYTGAAWEYVNQQLQPGLNLYTSQSHPWGGAPTYVLTNYIAGIRPVTFGYQTWIVEPAYTGFGLTTAAATVQTPSGPLSASWSLSVDGKTLSVEITAPKGTSGSFVLNRMCSGQSGANKVVQITGGTTRCFDVSL